MRWKSALIATGLLTAVWGCGDDNPAQVSVEVYGAEHVANNEFSRGMPAMENVESVVISATDPLSGEVLASETTSVESGGIKLPEMKGGDARRLDIALYDGQGQALAAGNTPLFKSDQAPFRRFRTLVGPVEDFSRIGALFSLAGGQESLNPTVFDDASLDVANTGRVGHQTAETSTGDILVVGGARVGGEVDGTRTPDIEEVFSDIQIFEPSTGHFTELGGRFTVEDALVGQDRLEEGRAFHSLTPLGGDRFLVAGGFGLSGESTRPRGSLEIIDLGASPGQRVQSMEMELEDRRGHHTATLRRADGAVIIAGGLGTGDDQVLDTIEVVNVRDEELQSGIAMQEARVGHEATLLEDRSSVWLTGGRDSQGTLATAEMVTLEGDMSVSEATFDLSEARKLHQATALGEDQNHQVLLTGGLNGDGATASYEMGTPLRSSEPFARSSWSLEYARGFHDVVQLPQSGDVVIFGGVDGDGQGERRAERHSIDLNNVQSALEPIDRQVGEMRFGRLGGASILVNNGHILVVGGQDQGGQMRNDAEYFIGYDPVR